jgi:hypothetical protein
MLINKDPKVQVVDEAQRDTVLAALRHRLCDAGTQRIGAANTALIITGEIERRRRQPGCNRRPVRGGLARMARHGRRRPRRLRFRHRRGAVTRSDARLSAAVSTVDDVDAESAGHSLLALSDLINGGRPGQYGVGQGASSVTCRNRSQWRRRRLVGVGVRVGFRGSAGPN